MCSWSRRGSTMTGKVRKRICLRHFIALMIILPRPARDIHRENSLTKKESGAFSDSCSIKHAQWTAMHGTTQSLSSPPTTAGSSGSIMNGVGKRSFFNHVIDDIILASIVLPRQARDKPRERVLKSRGDFKSTKGDRFHRCKTTLFELALHIPFMIRDPRPTAPHGHSGEVTAAFAENIDIYRTLAELAGLEDQVESTVYIDDITSSRYSSCSPTAQF
jgi:hypothetical protein